MIQKQLRGLIIICIAVAAFSCLFATFGELIVYKWDDYDLYSRIYASSLPS